MLDVPVGQPLEKQVCSQLFVLVACHVGLGRLYLAETQSCQSVDGRLLLLADHYSSLGILGLLALHVVVLLLIELAIPSLTAFKDMLKLVWVFHDHLGQSSCTL